MSGNVRPDFTCLFPNPSFKGWGAGRACVWRALFVALLMFAGPSFAETAEDLHRVEQKLSEQKAQDAQLEKKEKETAEEISDLQKQLIQSTAALQNKQNEQDALKEKLRDFERDIDRRTEALLGAETQIVSFADVLLRYSRQPAEVFLMRDPMTEDNWHRALLFRSFLPKLQRQTTTLLQELDELEDLRQKAAVQKGLVATTAQNLAQQRNKLDQLIKTRQGYLQKTTADREALSKELAALANEAKDLRQLMDKVSHSSVLPRDVKPPPLSAELKMPVSGKLVRGYGVKDEFGVVSKGLTLKAAASSPVVAPQDGRVAFTGPFRGYGQIVILQHSGGYHSFLAGFGRIDADVGQKVAAGEPLGVLPDKGDSTVELYFEWRHNGEPVNPTQWKNEKHHP